MKTAIRLSLAAFVLAGALSGAITPAKKTAQTQTSAVSNIGGTEPIPLCPTGAPYCTAN